MSFRARRCPFVFWAFCEESFQKTDKKHHGKCKKHRAGWKTALNRRSVEKMPVPSFISSNVRSIMGKLNDLRDFLQHRECKTAGAVLLQESWLYSDIENAVVSLDGFRIFRSDRPAKMRNRGGGVITYVSQRWCASVKQLFEISTTKVNALVLMCKPRFLTNFQSIILVNVYIAPDTPPCDLTLLSDTLSLRLSSHMITSLCVVAGDFNRFDTSFLSSLGMVNLVCFPTRNDAQLDALFVNNPTVFCAQRCAPLSTSDHCTLFLHPKIYCKSISRTLSRVCSRTIKKRNVSTENLNRLISLVASTDFSIFSHPEPTRYCELLTDYLNFCFDICCPIEVIYVRADRFSSPFLKQLRRSKERAYKAGQSSEVKNISMLINKEIQRLNKLYVAALLGNRNHREMWSALKQLCSDRPDSQLDLERLNNDFCAGSSIPCKLSSSLLSTCPPNPFTAEEVIAVLKKVNSNKAGGPDLLPPILLKSCAAELAEPLTQLFNFCLSSGKIPDCWRAVRIRPVPKKGSLNYRPIACTSVLLKTFERLLLLRMSSQLDFNDPTQFAYKPSLSTLDAISFNVHSIASKLDAHGGAVRRVFLDYSNAFGSLDRGVLLQKLRHGCVEDGLLHVLTDYFTDRIQFTSLGGASSSCLPVDSGVFQGAVLSPFFFSYYIKDLPMPHSLFCCKYADDIVIGSLLNSQASPVDIQFHLAGLTEWSTSHSLKLNASKCVDVIFSLKRGTAYRTIISSIPSLSVSSQLIPSSDSVKYLGMMLTHNLSWSPHVLTVSNKVRRLSFYSLKLRKLFVPERVVFQFVTACILPHLLYCSPVYFPGLKEKDFLLLVRSLKLLSRCSGIPRVELVKFIVSQHFNSCNQFSQKILSNSDHSLHIDLSQAISHSASRSQFKIIYARTTMYRNSTIPYLARLLVDRDKIISDLTSRLLS